jgi:SWI/SNF-related matrix-associated actin-dependent regulator of chromatin subfamily A3
MSHDPNFASDSDEFAAVRLRYDPVAKERSPTGEETIHILTPQTKVGEGPDEKVYGGENFGVVEQKVATVLGPMLGKGLIRVDAKVRRGMPNVRVFSSPSIYTYQLPPSAPHSAITPPALHAQG